MNIEDCEREPYLRTAQFDLLQLDLPLDIRAAELPVRTNESFVEWHTAQKVLSDYLSIVGAPEPGVTARALLDEFGSVSDLLAASWWRLCHVVGARLASSIRASRDLMCSALAEPLEHGPIVPRSKALISFLQAKIGFLQHERLLALYVDSRLHLLRIEKIADGAFGEVAVDQRKIISCGLRIGAAGFILVHNHPSGTPQPSQADLSLSSRLKRLAGELDLHLLDHLIVARGQMGSIVDYWQEAQWSKRPSE